VIFLDIDGVINSDDFYHRKHKTIGKRIVRLFNITIRSYIRWILTGSRYYRFYTRLLRLFQNKD